MGACGRSNRDTLRLEARALGAAVEMHYVSAPADVVFDRVRRRGTENLPIEGADLDRSIAMFQAPTPEEMALFAATARTLGRIVLPDAQVWS